MSFDTVEWSDQARAKWGEIRERLQSSQLRDLVTQVDDAWNLYREVSPTLGYKEKRMLLDTARDLTGKLNAFRDETASLAVELSRLRPLEQWRGDRVGTAVRTEGSSGSGDIPTWLASRKAGFGGSDIGDALDVTSERWSRTSREVVEEKATLDLDPKTVLDNLAQAAGSSFGATGRGTAWETVIAQMFQAAHADEFKVLEAKDPLKGPRQWQTANVDGLLCSDGETPDGILEIKTASKPWNGKVPIGYRAQVLNYLDATGLDYAYVAVLVNDSTYEEYRIGAGETLSGDPHVPGSLRDVRFDEAADRLDALWAEVLEARCRRYGPGWREYAEGMVHRAYDEIRRRVDAGEVDFAVEFPDWYAPAAPAPESGGDVTGRVQPRRRRVIAPEDRR